MPKKSPTLAQQTPPMIPGESPDVMIAITAASNAMGVPPAVAASTLAAAKSGDKKARKELEEAMTVYQSAHRGDPVALKQIAAVKKDMAAGYAPAAQKAAFLAAATGSAKGRKSFLARTVKAPDIRSLAIAYPLMQLDDAYRPFVPHLTKSAA